ncbi:MAG: YdeI/OmpD-associated family protein, partial [Candidatus Saccharibacteria bacterium]
METFKDGLPIALFETPALWREWLAGNPNEALGIWLKISKKGSGTVSVTYAEALDEALCYGWIDGQKQKYDDKYFIQRFTPRRPRSIWSQVNVAKVGLLIEQGRMMPAGQAAIDLAEADGRWDAAYASPSASKVPVDLQMALDANPQAAAFYATLNKANTYAINWRLEQT